ncbi:MAG TPA: ester cyclase [Acidimicrobiales bacterium]|jgi:predicted ester cyclase
MSSRSRSEAYTVMAPMFEEGFATGHGSLVDQLCSPALVEHQFRLSGSGTDGMQRVKDAIRHVHGAVRDINFSTEHSVENGDTIWVRVRARGAATGPFFGPPSGRPVDITVLDVARIVDGRIVEHWGVPDRFAMLAQTGILDRLA